MKDLIEKVEAIFAQYDNLYEQENPDSSPYASKYQARAILESYIEEVEEGISNITAEVKTDETSITHMLHGADIVATCLSKLGVNYIMTEENQTGEACVMSSLKWILIRMGIDTNILKYQTTVHHETVLNDIIEKYDYKSLVNDPKYSLDLLNAVRMSKCGMDSSNYLALIYSGWGNHPRSLRMLRYAKKMYNNIHKVLLSSSSNTTNNNSNTNIQINTEMLRDLIMNKDGSDNNTSNDNSKDSLLPALDALDNTYTHTLFYLAQIYAHLAVPNLSCHYIERTLCRQLEESIRPTTTKNNNTDDNENEKIKQIQILKDFPLGLPYSTLDKAEWTRNVLKLGDFYLSKGEWRATALTFYAAETMFGYILYDVQNEKIVKSKKEGTKYGTGVATSLIDKIDENVINNLDGPTEISEVIQQQDELRKQMEDEKQQENETNEDNKDDKKEENSVTDHANKVKNLFDQLPEHLQRLQGEMWIHWGNLYECILRSAWQRDVYQEYEITDEMKKKQENSMEDESDPFMTGPIVEYSKAGKRYNNDNSGKRGEGIDTIDVYDSDHEVHLSILSESNTIQSIRKAQQQGEQTNNIETITTTNNNSSNGSVEDDESILSNTTTTSNMRLSKLSKSPLAHFISSCPDPIRELLISYGPSRVGSIKCPATMYMSDLETMLLPDMVHSFENARNLFRASNAAYVKALSFYELDGFVTEHTICANGISKIYKYLAHSDPSIPRKIAMHTRRTDILQPLLDELNPTIYLVKHKEMSLELAVTYKDIFDLKSQEAEKTAITSKVKKSDLMAIQTASEKSIKAYMHFIRCYEDPRLGKEIPIDQRNRFVKPFSGATEIDDDSASAYATAHFCIARLLSRSLSVDVKEKLEDYKSAVIRYKWLIDNANKIAPSDDPSYFATELHMAKEMVSLLPERIAHMHYRGIDVMSPNYHPKK